MRTVHEIKLLEAACAYIKTLLAKPLSYLVALKLFILYVQNWDWERT